MPTPAPLDVVDDLFWIARRRNGCGARLKFGHYFCGDASRLGRVMLCDRCLWRPAELLRLVEVKAHVGGEHPLRANPRRSYFAGRSIAGQLKLQLLYALSALDPEVAAFADIGFAELAKRAAALHHGDPLVLRCGECGRWNYHLSGCSRKGLR